MVGSNKRMKRNNKAQVSLELGLAFVCAFIILLGGVKMCTWFIGRMVQRQEDYEASDAYGRVTATEKDTNTIGVEVDESNYQKMDLVR